MTSKTLLTAILTGVACVAAWGLDQPGLIGSGSTRSHDGWRLSYSTVAKPALPGQHTNIQSQLTHTDTGDGHVVFHRILGDPASKTYFGYDVVVEPKGTSAAVRFRPISVGPEQSRLLAIQAFPPETFESGKTMAITLMTNPATGQKVVDYVHVEHSYLDAIGQVLDDWLISIHRVIAAHHRAFTNGH
jgi:hypothetical protein